MAHFNETTLNDLKRIAIESDKVNIVLRERMSLNDVKGMECSRMELHELVDQTIDSMILSVVNNKGS